MAKHHDTGYKELFSHPEFVQQLIEGFAPSEIASLMDFSTLKNHSGNYITSPRCSRSASRTSSGQSTSTGRASPSGCSSTC
jgi:hypothetical protein